MSNVYPSSPGFSGLKITSLQPTLVSVAHSLARQVRSRGGQRWGIEATYPPNLTRAEAAPLLAFALQQRGQFGIFTLVLHGQWASARGVATGTPLVDLGSQTGRTVNTKGWTASVTGILRAGDFLKFNGHAKVYMVTADVNSTGAGLAAIPIEPALMAMPANNEPVIVNNVPFTVSFASDAQNLQVMSAFFHEFKASFVEVV